MLVDGMDVRDYPLEELHDRIGYVSQKAVLFSGTVMSNVALGERRNGKPSEAEVREAVSIAQAAEFVKKWTARITLLSPRAVPMCPAVRSSAFIARAIARRPEILIFDDSFSALDYKTDRTLRNGLRSRTADTTKLIVAQRISTIQDADQILVLDHGRIVGRGRHQELLASCSEYREIAESQMSKEELEHG